MTSEPDYLHAPQSVPTRFGRPARALRSFLASSLAPYFEQARLRSDATQRELARLQTTVTELQDELERLREKQSEMSAISDDATEAKGGVAALTETVRALQLELRAVSRRFLYEKE